MNGKKESWKIAESRPFPIRRRKKSHLKITNESEFEGKLFLSVCPFWLLENSFITHSTENKCRKLRCSFCFLVTTTYPTELHRIVNLCKVTSISFWLDSFEKFTDFIFINVIETFSFSWDIDEDIDIQPPSLIRAICQPNHLDNVITSTTNDETFHISSLTYLRQFIDTLKVSMHIYTWNEHSSGF